ncbi:MAG: dynamin family protein [Pseudomonadota bacterium]
MPTIDPRVKHRLEQLQEHLKQENPVLIEAVRSFRALDDIARRMGLLGADTSFATQIPWWPLISVLGTFSAGKSTFINHFLGTQLQRSGNQAVDDRFTVICYSQEQTAHALPGVALDADPRFPFYRISQEIEKVAAGEGSRIDAYLQLKTSSSSSLRGKIVIDSPGFDADAQRTSTLRITDHIIDLSDLVLVFFDARHPEPGAMRDTLDHLVSNTINRADAGKFLYILNQLDTAAREDNPEEVVAAWQRALGERGLTAGRFFTIYNPDAAVPITDPDLRRRFEGKRDRDLAEIHGRMQQVEVERAYRIVGTLEKTARDIEDQAVPLLREALNKWRRRTLIGDAVGFGAFLAALVAFALYSDFSFSLSALAAGEWKAILTLVVLVALVSGIHLGVRRFAAKSVAYGLRKNSKVNSLRLDVKAAFEKNTGALRSIFAKNPAGWGRGARRRLHRVIEETDSYVQTLNDRYTNPSGKDLLSIQHGNFGGPQAEAARPAPSAEQGEENLPPGTRPAHEDPVSRPSEPEALSSR